MGKTTGIDYSDASWSPWYGCTKVSIGCQNCYAEREMKKYGKDFNNVIRAANKTFYAPLSWKEPKKIFVCPWGDFFHKEADKNMWRYEALDIIADCPQHIFIIPTKRPERIINCLYEKNESYYFGGGDWLSNIWFLVSVENQEMADKRIPELLKLREYGDWNVLGLSIEPLLSDIDISYYLEGGHKQDGYGNWIQTFQPISWIVIGAESGSNRRDCKIEWVRSLVEQGKNADVPIFVKQLHIDGKLEKDIKEFPADLQIREYPK